MSTPERIAVALLAGHVITLDQLQEAQQRQRLKGGGLAEALIALGHATRQQVHYAQVRSPAPLCLDLTGFRVPQALLELLPESVARENAVLPLAELGRTLLLAAPEADDLDLIQKLEFILNRPISLVAAVREQIVAAIHLHYGDAETESVDSMLCEFTDTAIDFTETETVAVQRPEAPLDRAGEARPHPAPTSRHATVRYYHRMCPERTFPLLVVLSRAAVEQIVKRGVSQAHSGPFHVAEGSLVEIEPVLPGCACYPPREQVRIGAADTTTTFWVVPHVLGEVMQARVVIRQDGNVLAEVPIQARVARQTATLLMGAASLFAPFVLLLLKHLGLDFESQSKDGFSLYASLAGTLIRWLTPEVLAGLLLALTAGLYLWLRPRQRDVFWDVIVEQPAPPSNDPSPPPTAPQPVPAQPGAGDWLFLADRCYHAGQHAEALENYERVLGRPEARAGHYFRASLAAHLLDDDRRALGLLRLAEACLPPGEMRAAMWYNMGCFASRLGHVPDALDYLHRAAEAGLDDPRKYRDDPDLALARRHPAFRQLLVSLNA